MTNAIHNPRTTTRIGMQLAAILLCLMTLFGVSSAQAHDELISSTPASGAVLTSAPKSLVLTFSGDIKKIGTILELSDAEGTDIETSFAINRRDVTVTPAAPLDNGEYTLVARVVSSDGHPIDKKISFTVNDPAAAASSAAASSSEPASAASPTASAPVASPAEPTSEATASDTSIGGMPAGLVWTIAGLAGVGIIAVVLLKVRRQTK